MSRKEELHLLSLRAFRARCSKQASKVGSPERGDG